jgi:methionyl aminopeptidase
LNVRLKRRIVYKSSREIEKMREAGRIVGRILELMRQTARAGVSTLDLDTAAKNLGQSLGGEMAFFNYRLSGISYPFPGNICASIDEQVVHGIPSERKLQNGQIVSIDVGVRLDGYYGDAAVTIAVGEIDALKQRLIDVTRGALEAAIAAARPGGMLSDISAAVQNHVEPNGFSIVKDYVGHGIGQKLHEPPQVPNFVMPGLMGSNVPLKPGMTIAVEPMVNAGTHDVERLANEWTVVTRDRRPSAHFEHTLAITENGVEILTVP